MTLPAASATNALSPFAHEILAIDPGGAYCRLVVRGPGNEAARKLLADADPAQLISTPMASIAHARAMLSALWLWHDWLDCSHVISQKLPDSTGSFWHAIMHRREGDFDNSKYWYARCREHPVVQNMVPYAGDLLNHLPAHKSLLKLVLNGWNADAYVDLVDACHDSPQDSRHPVAVSLGQLEWRLLFDYCMKQASGQ